MIDNSIQDGSTSRVIATANAAYIWKFKATKHQKGKTMIVHISAFESDHVCSLVSVQPLWKPFEVENFSPGSHSRWQTMLGQAVIDVRLADDFKHGFFVVVQISPDAHYDTACFGNTQKYNATGRYKEMVMTVKGKTNENIALVSFLVVVVYLAACTLAIVMALCCAIPIEGQFVTKMKDMASRTSMNLKYRSKRAKANDNNVKEDDSSMECDEVDAIPMEEGKQSSTSSQDEVDFVQTFMSDVQKQARNAFNAKDNHSECREKVIVNLYKEHMKAKKGKCHERRKEDNLTLNDLAIKYDKDLFPNSIKLKSSLYLWIISLMGIFYTIPVSQLLLNDQKTSMHIGNLDSCYYNFLCKVQTKHLEDYNHVFSNIAYIISGIFFIVICRVRQGRYKVYHENLAKSNGDPDRSKRTGIPEHYGIFYALGGAVALEGILSGCYHICPTKVNFQFDTTFMYVIAVLIFLKVYQFRHPDITSNAHSVFLVIGFALFIEVLGYYNDTYFFWIFFILCYLGALVMFTIHTYYNGMFSLFKQSWINMYHKGKTGDYQVFKPARLKKFIMCSVVIVVNIIMALFFIVKRNPGVSKYLLVILMANMILYVTYYCTMKCYYCYIHKRKKERINPTCLIYFFISGFFMGLGMFFFLHSLKDSALTPAQSRDLNSECAILFFDNHDIWHFASAAGLFFNFMMILTLEDDNLETPWEQLDVF